MAAIPTTNPFFSGAVSSGSTLHSSSFHPIKRFSSISLNVSPSKPRPISAYFHESGDVTQVKIKATDGDDAVKLTNLGLGLLEKSGIMALRHRLQSVEAGYEPNQRLMIEELFKVGKLIMVKHNHSDLPNNKRSSKFDPIFLTKRRAFAPFFSYFQLPKSVAIFMGAGIALLSIIAPCNAAEFSNYREPWNALSIPTWAVHVSSVVEWATAMVLVWRYGEKSGLESWKGLSWGMVPLLAGALCACTWHFFYNSESLEVLVALQAAFTVFGNTTMCIAAYRIYMSSQEEL